MGDNKVVRGSDNVITGYAPCSIETIAADTVIPWIGLICKSDLMIYFINNPAKTWTFDAGETVLVHPGMRLSVGAECLVF